MTHKTLWLAIEILAKKNGLSCSGLAKLSGLDAITFNRSKQFSADGTHQYGRLVTLLQK